VRLVEVIRVPCSHCLYGASPVLTVSRRWRQFGALRGRMPPDSTSVEWRGSPSPSRPAYHDAEWYSHQYRDANDAADKRSSESAATVRGVIDDVRADLSVRLGARVDQQSYALPQGGEHLFDSSA